MNLDETKPEYRAVIETNNPLPQLFEDALQTYDPDAHAPFITLNMVDNSNNIRLCIPPSLEDKFMKLAHDDQNHGGIDRTYQNLRSACFFR